jgi:putative GTP pyrophosphokinase
VRTLLQHQWAELSEKLSDVIGASIKYGEGDEEALGLLATASKFIGAIESIEKPVADLRGKLQQKGFSPAPLPNWRQY